MDGRAVDRQEAIARAEGGRRRHVPLDSGDHDPRQPDLHVVAESPERDGSGGLLRLLHLVEVDLPLLLLGRAAEDGGRRLQARAARERPLEQGLEQPCLPEADVDEVDAAAVPVRTVPGDLHERRERVRAVGHEDVVAV